MLSDPSITIEVQWPGGRYSLPQPRAGCPAGWTSGWRGHDNENKNNKNTWNPRNLNDYVQIGLGADYTIYGSREGQFRSIPQCGMRSSASRIPHPAK